MQKRVKIITLKKRGVLVHSKGSQLEKELLRVIVPSVKKQ